MADTAGMYDLRGIDVQRTAVGFAEQTNIFKQFLTDVPASAREIRWYKKTAGFLDTFDTAGITASQIKGVPPLAIPDIVEQSWTRMTSNVLAFKAESPWISTEDIKDCDVDVLAGNIQDIVKAVENQIDSYIYGMLSGNAVLSGEALAYTSGGWSYTADAFLNPYLDLLSGATAIRTYGYDISNLVCLMHPTTYKWLMNYFVSVKGSSVPTLAGEIAERGVLNKIAGNKIVVSENCKVNYAVQLIPKFSAKWKSFMPLTTATKIEPLIGEKIRVAEEGVVLVEYPYSMHVIRTGLT